jgi:hypothetical protein
MRLSSVRGDRVFAGAERRLSQLWLGGEPVRHRVPLLRDAPAQASAEARAPRRRAARAAVASRAPAPPFRGAARFAALRRVRGKPPLRHHDRHPDPSAPRRRRSRHERLRLRPRRHLRPRRRRLVAIPRRSVRLRRHRLPVRGGRRAGDLPAPSRGADRHRAGALTAWFVLREHERRRDPTIEYDLVAVAVAAAVLLLLPVLEDFASPWAGIAGALVGAALGYAAARSRAA